MNILLPYALIKKKWSALIMSHQLKLRPYVLTTESPRNILSKYHVIGEGQYYTRKNINCTLKKEEPRRQ